MDGDGADTAKERLAEARLAAVLAVAGEGLPDEQRARIRARIAGSITQGIALRGVPLANGDEPEIVFAPYRGER